MDLPEQDVLKLYLLLNYPETDQQQVVILDNTRTSSLNNYTIGDILTYRKVPYVVLMISGILGQNKIREIYVAPFATCQNKRVYLLDRRIARPFHAVESIDGMIV